MMPVNLSVLKQRHSTGEASRRSFDLEGEATHQKTDGRQQMPSIEWERARLGRGGWRPRQPLCKRAFQFTVWWLATLRCQPARAPVGSARGGRGPHFLLHGYG